MSDLTSADLALKTQRVIEQLGLETPEAYSSIEDLLTEIYRVDADILEVTIRRHADRVLDMYKAARSSKVFNTKYWDEEVAVQLLHIVLIRNLVANRTDQEG